MLKARTSAEILRAHASHRDLLERELVQDVGVPHRDRLYSIAIELVKWLSVQTVCRLVVHGAGGPPEVGGDTKLRDYLVIFIVPFRQEIMASVPQTTDAEDAKRSERCLPNRRLSKTGLVGSFGNKKFSPSKKKKKSNLKFDEKTSFFLNPLTNGLLVSGSCPIQRLW